MKLSSDEIMKYWRGFMIVGLVSSLFSVVDCSIAWVAVGSKMEQNLTQNRNNEIRLSKRLRLFVCPYVQLCI